MNIELGQIGLDQFHHGRKGSLTGDQDGVLFGHFEQGRAIFGRQGLAHGHQIIARIEAGRDLDAFTQCLAITQQRRLTKDDGLPARVVDVVFARHVIARPRHERSQGIAEHGAAGVAHMHGAGGIGRHIFDIDPFALAQVRTAIILALRANRLQHLVPNGVRETEVDEARTGDLDGRHVRRSLETFHQACRDLARVLAQRLGDDHCGIGAQVAMGSVPRRFHHNARKQPLIELRVVGTQGLDDPGGEKGENVHGL
ncbi:hypothetical protein D3C87_1518590 [compost metagenome]